MKIEKIAYCVTLQKDINIEQMAKKKGYRCRGSMGEDRRSYNKNRGRCVPGVEA